MIDRFGREINYMRLSITDRCNLRCRYCMPDGTALCRRGELLTYEELLRVAEAAVGLGITRFKVTGGEPLVRRGCVEFLRQMKMLPGVEQVTLTTNGLRLEPLLPQLAAMGLDGVNVSADAADPAVYASITGSDSLGTVLRAVEASADSGIRTKLNCVLLEGCEEQILPLARFAAGVAADVRFIEVMPIGAGVASGGVSSETALEILRSEWPDLCLTGEKRGNGPARYYASARFSGRIGMIDAVSHSFCRTCNRVRLTSTGWLKPCLCYGEGVDLRAVLRRSPEMLSGAMRRAVWDKPRAHCFQEAAGVTERNMMSGIGG